MLGSAAQGQRQDLIQPDRTDYGHITFLFSTINHESRYTIYDFGYVRETTNDEYRKKYRALYELTSEQELVIRDKGYIETDPHITAMIGVKDADGQVQAILCVQRQMDVMARVRQNYVKKIIMVLIVLALLVIAGQSMFLHRTLLQPLHQISEEAKREKKTPGLFPSKYVIFRIADEGGAEEIEGLLSDPSPDLEEGRQVLLKYRPKYKQNARLASR